MSYHNAHMHKYAEDSFTVYRCSVVININIICEMLDFTLQWRPIDFNIIYLFNDN